MPLSQAKCDEKADRNGWNNASKSPKDLEVFFCPFFRKGISETNNLWYNILEVIQAGKYHRERAEYKSNAGQSDLYLKNKSTITWSVCDSFIWACRIYRKKKCIIQSMEEVTITIAKYIKS